MVGPYKNRSLQSAFRRYIYPKVTTTNLWRINIYSCVRYTSIATLDCTFVCNEKFPRGYRRCACHIPWLLAPFHKIIDIICHLTTGDQRRQNDMIILVTNINS